MPKKNEEDKSQGGILATNYDKNFPNTPTLTLAKKLYNEHPTVFKNVEDARTKLRYRRGQTGETSRKATGHKAEDLKFDYNPFKLPKSYAKDRKPFRLPASDDNILFISDLHVPYHNIEALTAAIKYGLKQKINTIFINGDLIDFHQISRFEKDIYKRSVKQEFDAARAILAQLRAIFPKAPIYWLKGNHDIRWEMFLKAKAPEIFDDEYFWLEERLGLNALNVKILDDKTLVKIGKLSVTHGHHVMKGFFAPVNSARGVYMKAKQSTIIGHVHKVSEHTETDMDGKIITTWSTGCLCELKPDYSPLVSNYAHGFAHITREPNGDYTVINKRILSGKIL